MGLKKAYDELTDNPEFSSGLTIATGESIKDRNGNRRITIRDGRTEIWDGDENRRLDVRGGGSPFALSATEDSNVIIEDAQQGYNPAIEYISDSSTGTLELSNADLDMSNNAIYMDIGTGGVPFRWDHDNDSGQKRILWSIFKDGNNTFKLRHDYDSGDLYVQDNNNTNRLEFQLGKDSDDDVVARDGAGNSTTLT